MSKGESGLSYSRYVLTIDYSDPKYIALVNDKYNTKISKFKLLKCKLNYQNKTNDLKTLSKHKLRCIHPKTFLKNSEKKVCTNV